MIKRLLVVIAAMCLMASFIFTEYHVLLVAISLICLAIVMFLSFMIFVSGFGCSGRGG
jgi:hypothetical protein